MHRRSAMNDETSPIEQPQSGKERLQRPQFEIQTQPEVLPTTAQPPSKRRRNRVSVIDSCWTCRLRKVIFLALHMAVLHPDPANCRHTQLLIIPSLLIDSWLLVASRFSSRLGTILPYGNHDRNDWPLLTCGINQVKCPGKPENGDVCSNCTRLKLGCNFFDLQRGLGMSALPLHIIFQFYAQYLWVSLVPC